MKRFKKFLSVLTVIAMMFTMMPIMTAPTFAASATTGVKFVHVDLGGDVHKLVFQAKTPTTIQMLGIHFSYDESIILPVAAWDTTVNADYDYVIDPNNEDPNGPLKSVLLASGAGDIQTRTFGMALNWKKQGSRVGFANALANMNNRTATSGGTYIDCFEFYFKFQPGKSYANITETTFKFETADDSGNILPLFFPSPVTVDAYYGIIMDEVSGTSQYRWGHVNTNQWIPPFVIGTCTLLGEVINPFVLDTLTVSLTAGNGIVTLAPQTAATGFAYYYTKSTATVAAPAAGTAISNITGAETYTTSTDIPGTNGTPIFIQVYKVETTGGTIVGFGEASATPTAPTYTVSVTTPSIASGDTHNFAGAIAGYAAITPTTFTITSTGTGAMTNLAVALEGTNPGSFVLSTSELNTTLASGGTTNFTIKPNDGLAVGSYTATVKITDSNLTPYTFNISFTVSPAVINIAAIQGVVPPAAGATPVTAITETTQYTGTVTWSGSPTTFNYSTIYTATITLTAKSGYTLTGVTANYFTVAGATSVSNSANNGVITAVFPATDAVPGQTVTFTTPSPGVRTWGDSSNSFTNAASSSGSGTITYQSSDTAVATVNASGVVTILKTGTVTITATAAAVTDQYAQGSNSYDLTINKKALANTMIGAIDDQSYNNGTAVIPALKVTDGSPSIITESDYTVSYSDNINVGAATATITATTDGNYSGTASITFTITKIDYAGTTTGTSSARYGTTGTLNLTTLSLPLGYSFGAVTAPTDTDSIISGTPSISGTTLSYTFVNDSAKVGSTAVIRIPVTSTNFNDFDLDITVTVLDKLPQSSFKFASTTQTKTYGDTAFTVTPTDQAPGSTISGYVSSDTDVATVNASGQVTIIGAGETTITAIASATSDYAETTASYTLTVNKKTVTVAAGNYSIAKVYDGTTAAGTASGSLTVSGILAADTATAQVTPGTLPDYANANVQTGTMLALPISLTGTGAGNYTLGAETSINVPASITKKDISIDTVAPLTKDYDGTASATAGAVTFTDEAAGQALVLNTDYTVNALFTGGNYDAGISKPYTYTITILTTTKTGNYNLTGGNTKTGANGTINKITYTGTTAVSVNVEADEVTTDRTVTLPALPTGAAYAATGTVGGATALIDGTPTISDTTLTFDATDQSDGTTATITIAVTGATNFNNYDVVVIVRAQDALQEDTPAASIDYINERLTGLVASAAYEVDGAVKTADSNGRIAIEAAWFEEVVDIVKIGSTLADSDPQNLSIPARLAAPAGVGKTDTTGGNNNGTITGVTTAMEYKLSTASAWTAITDNMVTSLAAGTYQVRVKATILAFASETASVTIAGSSGGANPGSSGGGGSSSPSTSNTAPAGDGSVSVSYTSSGGTVTLSMPESKVAEIINAAKDDKAVIDLSKVSGATNAVMPAAAFTSLANSGLDMEIKLAQGTVTLDSDAAKSVTTQAGNGNVSVEFKQLKVSDLKPEQRSSVRGSDIIVDINISSGAQKITEFDGKLTVTVPYNGPLPAAVWYLKDNGELEMLESSYDPVTKAVTFSTDHLSLYVIGVGEPTPITPTMPVNPFTDVRGTDWFIDAVIYVYNNGLMTGTSTEPMLFSPGAPLTRGMVVTVLHRMENTPSVSGVNNPFSDVAAGLWYTNAVIWAAENGVVGGYGNGRFGPNDNITREQLAAMLNNYANYAGLNFRETRQIVVFNDDAKIADYAKEAIARFVRASVISGKPDNMFDPKGNATRAEFASVLMRFVEASAGQMNTAAEQENSEEEEEEE